MPIVADQQLEDLTAITTAAGADELLINDVSDTTDDANGSPKKILVRNLAGGLGFGAQKTASFTAEVGQLYPIDANNGGTGLGANIAVTFPTSPTKGDLFGYFIEVQNVTDTAASGFALAPFWGVEPNDPTINNLAYTKSAGDGVEKWGLLIDSEMLIFRYYDATVGWQVIHDGRIALRGRLTRATDQTGLSDAATDTIEYDTIDSDFARGNLEDTAAFALEIKRAGIYRSAAAGRVVGKEAMTNNATGSWTVHGRTNTQYGMDPSAGNARSLWGQMPSTPHSQKRNRGDSLTVTAYFDTNDNGTWTFDNSNSFSSVEEQL